MAAETNARQNKQATLAFTLPISCQICLGKVKQPVLCPNSHVFCSPCMDVWLQKNQQCPSCRITITTPKQILGGLSQFDDDSEKMTNPNLRKARFELLYKEYENEFERLSNEVQLLKTENGILKQQVKRDGATDGRSSSHSDTGSMIAKDTNGLLLLTKKLQDVSKQYEKVKSELTKLKQENNNLKDENVNLNRENQHLRSEVANRSPHRFGRTTVATLETKVKDLEKQVNQLNKALEKSDKYIEDLERERDELRGKPTSSASTVSGRYTGSSRTDLGLDRESRRATSDTRVPSSSDYGVSSMHKRQLFEEDRERNGLGLSDARTSTKGEGSKYYYDRNGDLEDESDENGYYADEDSGKHYGKAGSTRSGSAGVNRKGEKRVTFDLPRDSNQTTSFDLEMPSPFKTSGNKSSIPNGRASPVKGVLKNSKKSQNDDTLDISKPQSVESISEISRSHNQDDSLLRDYLKPTSKYSSKDDDFAYSKGRSTYSSRGNDDLDLYSKARSSRYATGESVLSEPSDLDLTPRNSDRDRDYLRRKEPVDLDDTQLIESELDELNISLTPDFTDCMKLLNRAEKKVHTRSGSEEDEMFDYKPSYRDAEFRASTGSISARNPALDVQPSGVASRNTEYRSSNIPDAQFRASTGSMNLKPNAEDYTKYKPPSDFGVKTKFDFSRGRHARSASLDNLLTDMGVDPYKASSVGASTGTGYSSLPPTGGPQHQTKYSSLPPEGTRLGRAPSVDNLFTSGRPHGMGSRFSAAEDTTGFRSRISLPPYGSYHGEKSENNVDVNTMSTGQATSDVTSTGHGARPNALGTNRTRSYSDMGTSVTALASSGKFDADRPLSSGRSTPTNIPSANTEFDLKSGTKTYDFTTSSSTNFREMDFKDRALKPPSGSRNSDSYGSSARLSGASASSSVYTNPSIPYPSSSQSYPSSSQPYSNSSGALGLTNKFDSAASSIPPKPTVASGGRGFDIDSLQSDLPSYGSRAHDDGTLNTNYRVDTGEGGLSRESHRRGSLDFNYKSKTYDIDVDKFGDNYSRSSSAPIATDLSDKMIENYRNKYGGSESSSRISADALASLPSASGSSLPSARDSVKQNSGYALSSFAGSSKTPSLGLDSYPSRSLGPSSSSSSSTSYLPSSLTSVTSSSSYSTAHHVPSTLSSLSHPSNTYSTSTRYMDPITETSNHYSYVSNASAGDMSSRQSDTLALPEPKKRLFESSDDLNLSVSPIKSKKF